MSSGKSLNVVQRDSFFDDSFFKEAWGDFDNAVQRVLDKFDNRGLKVDDGSRNECRDAYTKIRSNKIDEDLYGSQAVQINEKDGKFQVVMDVKDFNPRELQVRAVDERIVVEGGYQKVSEDGTSKSLKSFYKEFTLPDAADIDHVTTALSKDGVLTIRAPKKEGAAITEGPKKSNSSSSSSSMQQSSFAQGDDNSNSSFKSSSSKKVIQSSSSFESSTNDGLDALSKDMRERLMFSDSGFGSTKTSTCSSPAPSEAGSECSRVSSTMEFDLGKKAPVRSEVSFNVSNPSQPTSPPMFQTPPMGQQPPQPMFQQQPQPMFQPQQQPMYQQPQQPMYQQPQQPTYQPPQSPTYQPPQSPPAYQQPQSPPTYQQPQSPPAYQHPQSPPTYQHPQSPTYQQQPQQPMHQQPQQTTFQPGYQQPQQPMYQQPMFQPTQQPTMYQQPPQSPPQQPMYPQTQSPTYRQTPQTMSQQPPQPIYQQQPQPMTQAAPQAPKPIYATGSGNQSSINITEENGRKVLTSQTSNVVQEKDGIMEHRETAAEITDQNSQAARREASTKVSRNEEDPEGKFKRTESADAAEVNESCVQQMPDGSVMSVKKSSTSNSSVKSSFSSSTGPGEMGMGNFFQTPNFPTGFNDLRNLMDRGHNLMSQMSTDSMASTLSGRSGFTDMSNFSHFSDASSKFSDMSNLSNISNFSDMSSTSNQNSTNMANAFPQSNSSRLMKSFSTSSSSSSSVHKSFSSSFDGNF